MNDIGWFFWTWMFIFFIVFGVVSTEPHKTHAYISVDCGPTFKSDFGRCTVLMPVPQE